MDNAGRERKRRSADAREVVCPHCGASIRATAAACPECGSDEQTGWSDNTYLDGISLPADDDDYDDIYEREFGEATAKGRARSFLSWKTLTALAALAAFGALLIRSGW
jgi:hypothetical protein